MVAHHCSRGLRLRWRAKTRDQSHETTLEMESGPSAESHPRAGEIRFLTSTVQAVWTHCSTGRQWWDAEIMVSALAASLGRPHQVQPLIAFQQRVHSSPNHRTKT